MNIRTRASTFHSPPGLPWRLSLPTVEQSRGGAEVYIKGRSEVHMGFDVSARVPDFPRLRTGTGGGGSSRRGQRPCRPCSPRYPRRPPHARGRQYEAPFTPRNTCARNTTRTTTVAVGLKRWRGSTSTRLLARVCALLPSPSAEKAHDAAGRDPSSYHAHLPHISLLLELSLHWL